MNRNFLKKWTCFALVLLMVTAMVPLFTASASAAETKTYEKVTTAPADWSGEYLIVYEAGSLIFDGSLAKLDAAENYQSVTIADSKITTSSAYSFTIATVDGGYSIKSASGLNIGRTATSNGMNSGADDFVNTIALDTEGNAKITSSGGPILYFNSTSNQMRFRYFASTQKSIALYKLVETTGGESGETPVVHTHEYVWDGNVGSNGSHTLACESTVGTCNATTKTESCTYENAKCSVCSVAEPVLPKYVLTDLADITSNMSVIIVATKNTSSWAMSNNNGSSKAPAAVVVTIDGDTISTDATNILWNIANNNGTLTIYPAGQTEKYLYCTDANNGVRVGTTTAGVGTFTMGTNGYLTVATTTTRYLGVYTSTPDWRCYTNTTGNIAGQEFAFYVLSTDLSDCEHVWINDGEPTPPTCTEDGAQPQKCEKCGNTKELAIPATGHTLVDGVCSVCTTDFNYTIPEALEAADGTDVIVKGTVSFVNEAWNTTFNNMNVTIKDKDGNELYIYRLATKVEVGDIITVTGKMGTYNSARQIAQGATAVITGHEDIEVVYDEVTIPEAIASADDRLVTFSGTVTDIAGDWNGNTMNLTVSDAAGNSIYLYKLSTEVALYDIITVKGVVGTHNDNKQIVSATAEITGSIAPKINSVSLTLNKGVMVNVTYNISAEWLAQNEGAEIVFSNGEKFAAVAGVNTYSAQLTPGKIADALKVGINEATVEVSVAKYTEKVKAATAAAMGLTEAKYDALVALLDKTLAYGAAATATGSALVNEAFTAAGDQAVENDAGILVKLYATLAEKASVQYEINNASIPGATVVVTLNGAEIANGALASYLNADNQLVINDLCPANFSEEIVITIKNAEGTVVAKATFTFNQYLKALYNGYKAENADVANMAAAAYQYGLATEAFRTAE